MLGFGGAQKGMMVMIRMCALALLALPLVAQASETAQPIPNETVATVAVSMECTVQPDMTVKDCVVTNGTAVSEGAAMDAVHAIEAKSTPVQYGKPGDKVHITMKLDH